MRDERDKVLRRCISERTCIDEAQSILKGDVPSQLTAYKTGSRQTLLSRLLFSERSSKCLTSLGPTDVKDDRRDPPSPGELGKCGYEVAESRRPSRNQDHTFLVAL